MAEFDPDRDNHGVDDPRLTALDAKLRDAKAREATRTGSVPAGGGDGGYSLGNRVLSAMIGSLVGGALIGWVIDRLAGTAPWGLIVMLFLGIGVAFRQIIKMSGERPE
ncbi:AtpZ/AtpI family protein [uncultured Sphingomonas sp.]|uniref:AtpZ/AtpI family protein n=1 Tax=uncultured Sphingomonas sp. TaxID=158754 RepID=UPI0035C95EDF